MRALAVMVCAFVALGCAHSRGWQDDEGERIDGIVGAGGEMPDQAAFDGIPVPRTAPASAAAHAPSTFPSLVKQKPSKPIRQKRPKAPKPKKERKKKAE